MSDPVVMYLLNCSECDDIQLLVDKPRTCECGKAQGRLAKSRPVLEGTTARLFVIPWESYDLAATGLVGQWRFVDDA